MADLKETRSLLGDLISFETVSDQSNLGLISFLADRLDSAGARVEIQQTADGQKANLFATLGPDAPGGIVLSGHSDVVPVTDQLWTSDPFHMWERDGRLYGRGSCDMKGFIAAAVAMAPEFAAAPLARPIHYAFTHDEEVGCLGAKALADWLTARGVAPSVAIIGEPTGMQIVEGHKGCCEYSTYFTGLAGHSSTPGLGVNAVEFAVRYVSRLIEISEELKLRAPEGSRFDPPWTTVSTGALNGGQAHNVIPSTARVDWEFRPVQTSDYDYVRTEIDRYAEEVLLPAMRLVSPAAAIATEVIGEVAGLEPATVNEARDILMELTGRNSADVVAFGTEAGIFSALGMSVVVCGPGSIDQAHKPDEFVSLQQLGMCLSMLERLCRKLQN